jgi:hypothetical protein
LGNPQKTEEIQRKKEKRRNKEAALDNVKLMDFNKLKQQ